ncbi:Glucose-6-phosphate 1-dehydrogenase [Frankliniella fusca]|uniref:Glucose-6-phosphate 1-dehydrogenase n=1 Tax=Frankliniella fusca TaxID=407009 RepID=A0AAE1HMI6_9NEOP|nr:Glucose-6-phosphate 1-dehydrogenase [Frankliniella fusca]
MAEHRRRVATRLSLRFRLRDASTGPLDVTVEAFVSVYRMPQDVFMLLVQTLEPFKLQTTSGRATPFYMKGPTRGTFPQV